MSYADVSMTIGICTFAIGLIAVIFLFILAYIEIKYLKWWKEELKETDPVVANLQSKILQAIEDVKRENAKEIELNSWVDDFEENDEEQKNAMMQQF